MKDFMIFPPALRKNDTIGIMCPSGYLDAKKAAECILTLKSWGYQVQTGSTLGGSCHYFSGSDQQRAAELQQMMDDPHIHAILCGRGGYGLSRIIDLLDFRGLKKHPKWIIGYSDVTLLHLHLQQKVKMASLHAPMAAAFNKEHDTSYLEYLKKTLAGKKTNFLSSPHSLQRSGKASGKLIGGNLALLAHSIGSVSEPNLKDCLLFMEDVGEYLYTLDRMLQQIRRAGWFHKINGLIIGGFTETKDTTLPFGQDIEHIIAELIAPFDFPVAYGFPVGHQDANLTLKCGADYELTVRKSGVRLKEIS